MLTPTTLSMCLLFRLSMKLQMASAFTIQHARSMDSRVRLAVQPNLPTKPKERVLCLSAQQPLVRRTNRSWDGRPVADHCILHPHTDIAHRYWDGVLQAGDSVVDATAGNGFDSLELAQQLGLRGGGFLTVCDIQESAIIASKKRLREADNKTLIEEDEENWLFLRNAQSHQQTVGTVHIRWYLGCHRDFMLSARPHSVKLITFNLGYLPGGNKEVVTQPEVTVATLNQSLAVLETGGAITATCYPGHPVGEQEEKAVVQWATSLPQQKYSCFWHQWINQKNKRTGKKAPSLVLVQKLG